jgi:hypothetical protein
MTEDGRQRTIRPTQESQEVNLRGKRTKTTSKLLAAFYMTVMGGSVGWSGPHRGGPRG